jgi:hypothetical protein
MNPTHIDLIRCWLALGLCLIGGLCWPPKSPPAAIIGVRPIDWPVIDRDADRLVPAGGASIVTAD